MIHAYYLFSDAEMISTMQDHAAQFFSSKPGVGYNKQKQLCWRGFIIQQYAVGGTVYQPIIFNSATHEYVYDWKEMGMDQPTSIEYTQYLTDTYQDLENSVFVFFYNKDMIELAYTKYYPVNLVQLSEKLHTIVNKPRPIPEITYGDEHLIF